MFKIYKIISLFIAILLFLSKNIFAKEFVLHSQDSVNYKFITTGNASLTGAAFSQEESYRKSFLPDQLSKNYYKVGYHLVANSEINLGLERKSNDNILDILANFKFNIDSTKRKRNPYLDKIAIGQDNKFGRFEIGNIEAVNQKMKYDPAKFARGAGGIRGKYLEYVNLPIIANYNQSINGVCQNNISDSDCKNIKVPGFILLAQSPIGHGGYSQSYNSKFLNNNSIIHHDSYSKELLRSTKDDSFDGKEDATKISYFSPDFNGLKFGFSYTPNSNDNGLTKNITDWYNEIEIKNIFSAGINYLYYLPNGASIAISSTFEKGTNVQHNIEDLLAYDFAINMNYFGFDLGFSYGIWQKYSKPKNGIYSCPYNSSQQFSNQDCSNNNLKYKKPYYIAAGLAYEFGPFATSITSFNSNFHNNKFNVLSLGVDYKLQKYLIPYFEITNFSFESDQPIASDIVDQLSISPNDRQVRDNNGMIFLTGISYIF